MNADRAVISVIHFIIFFLVFLYFHLSFMLNFIMFHYLSFSCGMGAYSVLGLVK